MATLFLISNEVQASSGDSRKVRQLVRTNTGSTEYTVAVHTAHGGVPSWPSEEI